MAETYPGLSPKAVDLAFRLAGERLLPELGTCGEERLENLGALLENGLRWPQLSALIDRLQHAPQDLESVVPPGVYQRDDGEIFVVKFNRQRTGVYAKRLVEVTGDRLTEDGDRVKVDFEYAPRALSTLTRGQQMTLEAARPYLVRYENCMVCGVLLRAATSVERSIGPVCVRMFVGWEASTEPDPLPPGTEDDLAALLTALEG